MLSRLQEAMVAALRAKDTERLSVIRMLISEVKNEAYKEGAKRSAEEVVAGYLKKLNKAAEEFASKSEFVDKVKKEIKIVSEFVPQPLTKLEIVEAIVKGCHTGDVSMKTVMPLVKGRADGNLVKDVVKWFNEGKTPADGFLGEMSAANMLKLGKGAEIIDYVKELQLCKAPSQF